MTVSVLSALFDRYSSPAYACFTEVSESTGSMPGRRADFLAMGCWPSRGVELHGFEIKIDRRDFLREMKDPAKSSGLQRFCDYWWMVIGDDSVAKFQELPSTWGLLVLRKGKLVQVKAAPKLEAEPLTRAFIASLLRSASANLIPKSIVDERVHEAVKQVRIQYEDQILKQTPEDRDEALELSALRAKVEMLEKQWSALTEIVGADVVFRLKQPRYGDKKDSFASAIRYVAEGHLNSSVSQMDAVRYQLKVMMDQLDNALVVAKGVDP